MHDLSKVALSIAMAFGLILDKNSTYHVSPIGKSKKVNKFFKNERGETYRGEKNYNSGHTCAIENL